jgi:hypothetical protein
MASGIPGLLAVWSDLPDPTDPATPHGRTCQIHVGQKTWDHVYPKHIQPGREPWGEWIPTSTLTALAAAVGSGPADLIEEVLRLMEEAVCESLGRPLVLLYQRKRLATDSGRCYWVLVLRNGAKAVVQSKGSHNELDTCFYPERASRARSLDQRWERVVEDLVLQHTVLVPAGQRHPGPTESFSSGEYIHDNVVFVNPLTWGFLVATPGGRVWQGWPLPWPTAAPAPAPAPVPSRLRLRRRRDEEATDV